MAQVDLANRLDKLIVDDDDYFKVSQWSWSLDKATGYAHAKVNSDVVRIHNFLITTEPGQNIIYKNKNKLDARRSNLIIGSRSQAIANSKLRKDNTTGYKGVSYIKRIGKFVAKIKVNQKAIYLGSFDDVIDAARAYDEAAKNYFGRYARLNFTPANTALPDEWDAPRL